MSQGDIDNEFDALLNDDGMAEVERMVATDAAPEAPSAAGAAAAGGAAAVAKAAVLDENPKPAAEATTMEAKKQPAASTKPTLGKKRQLLVPQVAANKRLSVEVKGSSGGSERTALPSPKEPSPSAPSPSAVTAPEPANTAATADPEPEPSSASSPTKAKPTREGSKDHTKAADDMEVDDAEGGDTEMGEAAAEHQEEPEVTSPPKKAPRPATESAAADDSADAPSNTDSAEEPAATVNTAATAATANTAATAAPSSKALAAGKRKGLTLAPSTACKPSAAPKPSTSKASTSKAGPKAAPKAAAAAGGTTSSAAEAEAAGRKLPRAQTAFFFFSGERRKGLKESEPGLSMPETSKRLGEMWKALSEEEKKPYNDKAEADKERVAAELAAMGTEVVDAIKKAGADARAAKKDKKNAKGGADKAADDTKQSKRKAATEEAAAAKATAKAERAAEKEQKAAAKREAARKDKAAMREYSTAQFSTFKDANPDKEGAELMEIIVAAWGELAAEDKEVYFKKADVAAEIAAAAKAGKAAAGRKGSKAAGKRGRKKASAGSDAEEGDGGSDDEETVATGGSRRRAAAAHDDDDESDREDIDWAEHPAAGILCVSSGSYLVKREGTMLSDYGKVDARKAKQSLMHGGAGSSAEGLHVSAEQVEEYERYYQRFWAAVKGRMHKGMLDLEELEEGSPMEACFFMAKLQEPGGILDPNLKKRPNGETDTVRRLPVMNLAMVVQRLMDLKDEERRKGEARSKAVLAGLVKAVQDEEGVKEALAAAEALLESSS